MLSTRLAPKSPRQIAAVHQEKSLVATGGGLGTGWAGNVLLDPSTRYIGVFGV